MSNKDSYNETNEIFILSFLGQLWDLKVHQHNI